MPQDPKSLPGLSEAEWEIMKCMWDHGPMAVGEVVEKVADDNDWAYSTVKTLMRRMVDKGWLAYRRVGNSFLYRAAVPRKKALRSAVKDFSNRVLDGLLSPFVAYYAEEKELSAEDLEQLEEILQRHRRGE